MKTWSKHIAGWALFMIYEISFVRLNTGQAFPLANYFFYYGLNIALFYTHAYAVLRAAGRPAPYLRLPALVLLELAVYLAVKYTLDYFLAPPHNSFNGQLVYIRRFLVMNVFRGIYFTAFSTLYWAVRRMLHFREQAYTTEKKRLLTLNEKTELERDLAEARNAYLQQQINPHLLFNTLTFIYNSYYTCSPQAAECVLLLSDILRFSLYEADEHGKTLLSEEIGQIQNFIQLNQLRFDYPLELDFQTAGDFTDRQIIPLVLLTLTENIFKHGYLKTNKNAARLHIRVDNRNELRFESWNLKKHQPANRRRRAIGIQNVIKRLNFSYPGNYQLVIQDEPESYGLALTIQL